MVSEKFRKTNMQKLGALNIYRLMGNREGYNKDRNKRGKRRQGSRKS